MEKFTHGIIAIDPLDADEEDNLAIVHFIGLWKAPTKEAFEDFVNEIKTDPEFGLTEIADRLVILPAPSEIVEIYNEMVQEHENSKLN
jgi:hypothetical protein